MNNFLSDMIILMMYKYCLVNDSLSSEIMYREVQAVQGKNKETYTCSENYRCIVLSKHSEYSNDRQVQELERDPYCPLRVSLENYTQAPVYYGSKRTS